MTVNVKQTSKRVTNAPLPNTQVSSRNDIFSQKEEQEQVDDQALAEDAKRMDLLMRQLMGGDDEEEVVEAIIEEEQVVEEEEGEFSFRLFSNQTVATVKIADEKDNTDQLAKAIADQQQYEFDETDPDFVARVEQAAVDYDTILKQSTTPYPTMRLPHRVLHIKEEPVKKITKKRKSKKCRDFEKAVKEGKIVLKKDMRKSEDGWPGWPGHRTRVAIVDYQAGPKKSLARGGGARGGMSRGGGGRGMSRGGSSRGRGGRGKSF